MHLERGDRPVCDRKTLSPSTTPSLAPKVAFLVLYLPSSTPRHLALPSPPTRVKAGKSAWEPQEARILLESGKSLS